MMLKTTTMFANSYTNVTDSGGLSPSSYLDTTSNNASLVPDGCIEVRFDQMGYLPWDNPDNIVSAEVEDIVRRFKDAIFVPLLFLIGAPGNVINMAVFCKQGLKNRVNLCLFALALADELYLIYAIFLYGEQLPLQFTTRERYGQLTIFIVNHNLAGFFGLVLDFPSPVCHHRQREMLLRPQTAQVQTLLKTKTTAVIIAAVYVLVTGPYFLVVFKYRIACVHDPFLGITINTSIAGEFYRKHKQLIDYLDSFVYGAGIPGFAMVVVLTTTIVTTVKLREIVTWRAESTSCLSAREVALTKMLIGTSVLFVVCVSPIALFRFVWLFLPEMNSGRRQQNFFLTSLWILGAVSYINSSFNVFVYYAMGSHYRQTFWALFSRRRGSAEDGGGSHRKPNAEMSVTARTGERF